ADVDEPRLISFDDFVFRRLDPCLWNPETGEVYPAAVQDEGKWLPHERLSLHLARCYGTPGEYLLALAARFQRRVRRQLGSSPIAEQIYALGYGVAVLIV